MPPDSCFRCGVVVVDSTFGFVYKYARHDIAAGTYLSETRVDLAAGEILELIPKNDFQCLPMASLDVGWLW
jgi:hypothetical protein